MSISRLSLLLLLLPACSGAGVDPADTAAADDSGTVDSGPHPAALAPLSSGECPDLTVSGTSSFQSSGEERQVTIVLPSEPAPGMAVDFFFHGVTDPSTTSNPGGDSAAALDLQAEADATNTVWVVPDAPVQNVLGMMDIYLWDLSLETDHDLVLYDDLRTCVGENLDVDLSRLSIVGFSGGALWTTVVAVHRGDTIATAVELSGGSDVEAVGFDSLLSEYATPATDFPVLLTTGGDTDVWPSTQFVVVDFTAATDTLQGELLADDHFVVRCADDNGHQMGRNDWSFAKDWIAGASFGADVSYEGDGLGDQADWCEVPTLDAPAR